MNLEQVSNEASSTALSSSGGISIFFWLLTIILVLVLMGLLYFLLNRLMKGGKRNTKIGLIKKFYIDKNFYIGILKIFDEYYMVLFSNSSSEVIKKIDYDEIQELLENKSSFVNTFASVLNKESKDNEK
ncbi:MAG: flagellar protein FliO/FliZ [Geotoga sp.]|jgi:flagellar protein FliO/FliZ|nr:flagellar protein FliO/FliZ [Geotoga sp.]